MDEEQQQQATEDDTWAFLHWPHSVTEFCEVVLDLIATLLMTACAMFLREGRRAMHHPQTRHGAAFGFMAVILIAVGWRCVSRGRKCWQSIQRRRRGYQSTLATEESDDDDDDDEGRGGASDEESDEGDKPRRTAPDTEHDDDIAPPLSDSDRRVVMVETA